MPRSSRLGSFKRSTVADPVPTIPAAQNVLELPTPGSNDGAITVSYRGTSSPQTNRFDFGEFSGFPVIYNHREQIYRKIVQGRSSSTIEVLKQAIHEVGKFFTWVAVKHKISVVTASDIDLNVSSLVYLYLDEIGAQYRPLNFFRRLLRAIGVDEGDIPMNIFLSGHATASDAVPIETVVRMYTHFKGELSIILNRSREFQGLVSIGHDPRRDFGGKVGDWDHPANRLHVLLNSIGTDIKPVQGLRKTVDGAAVAGLQRYPGAMTLRRDGCHKRRYGVTGHLAWLYPSERDLLPFVVLLLVKTRFNVSVITGLELGRYDFRPLALKYGTSERTVQFSARKFKSVNDADQEPSFVHSLCLTKPYAHPYQIIRFLEVELPLKNRTGSGFCLTV